MWLYDCKLKSKHLLDVYADRISRLGPRPPHFLYRGGSRNGGPGSQGAYYRETSGTIFRISGPAFGDVGADFGRFGRHGWIREG